jgi:hypothetical protein
MIFYCLNLMVVFTINIFVQQNKSLVVNLFQWHQKLQHLFRGTL